MSDNFIKVMRGPSAYSDNKMQTIYVNKNLISGYSSVVINNKECLVVDINTANRNLYPNVFHVCKDDDPITYNKLYNDKFE